MRRMLIVSRSVKRTLLRWPIGWHGRTIRRPGSDGKRQFVEGYSDSMIDWRVDRDVVVAASEVLDEGVTDQRECALIGKS